MLTKQLFFRPKGQLPAPGSVHLPDSDKGAFSTVDMTLDGALSLLSVMQSHFDFAHVVEPGRISVANSELGSLTVFTGDEADLVRIWAALYGRPPMEVVTPEGTRLLVRLKTVSGKPHQVKPDLEYFRRLSEELGVKPDECVFIGDHLPLKVVSNEAH